MTLVPQERMRHAMIKPHDPLTLEHIKASRSSYYYYYYYYQKQLLKTS